MKLSMGTKWEKVLQGRIESVDFEVGILDDKQHKDPVLDLLNGQPQLTEYAGGPVQKTSRVNGELTIGEVLIENQKRMNMNILQRPFQEKSSDILKFTTEFLKMVCTGKASFKRLENLLQAIVRNPILKQEYGPNDPATADAKGFDRHLFGTGQMFKAIKARVKRV